VNVNERLVQIINERVLA